MVQEIVIYPDKRLKLISKEVTSFDTELHTLLDDMYDTMISRKGVGLAAIQIGVAQRVLIINLPEDDADEVILNREETLEIINPIFTKKEGSCKQQEGCLSIPGVYEDIERAKEIVLEYQDRHGEKHTIINNDFLAIALQHEIDHLDGKVLLRSSRLSSVKSLRKSGRRNLSNNTFVGRY